MMSAPEQFPPVLPVVSVLYSDSSHLKWILSQLQLVLGEAVLFSEPFPFDMTDYYRDEMGADLFRVWFCFAPLRDPSELPRWKTSCAELEKKGASGGKRVVNIDPGYLDHGKLVLASFKQAPDKIYMGNGVFAHTCLVYRNGGFHGPVHSFADFTDGRFNSFFSDAKQLLRKLLRERSR